MSLLQASSKLIKLAFNFYGTIQLGEHHQAYTKRTFTHRNSDLICGSLPVAFNHYMHTQLLMN